MPAIVSKDRVAELAKRGEARYVVGVLPEGAPRSREQVVPVQAVPDVRVADAIEMLANAIVSSVGEQQRNGKQTIAALQELGSAVREMRTAESNEAWSVTVVRRDQLGRIEQVEFRRRSK